MAPITQAHFAIEAIQCFPAPSRNAPATFGHTVLPFLTNPPCLCFLVRRTRIQAIVALQGPNRFFCNQDILVATSAARSK